MARPLLTIRDLLRHGRSLLSPTIAQSGPESLALLATASKKPDTWLLAHDTEVLPRNARRTFLRWVGDRRRGKPFAYLVGWQPFAGHRIRVTPAVLIPRPATETLVADLLARYQNHTQLRVLDVGTGSGCIAIAIAAAQPTWTVEAIEPSTTARAVATKNIRQLVPHRVKLFATFHQVQHHTYDIIVANLPYLTAAERRHPSLRYEPTSALVGGGRDGGNDIRTLIGSIAHPPCRELLLECLPRQYRAIHSMLKSTWPHYNISRQVAPGGIVIGVRAARKN